jgi:hypothetical protein
MTRTEIRDFLQAGVNALTPVPEFGSGLVSDFNSIRSHEYPAVWQVVAQVTAELTISAPLDSWEIDLIVAQKDRMDSSPSEYEHIIDDCDLIAQKLVFQYRDQVSGYKLVTMTGVSREPFVKKYADCLSGVNLKFTLVVQNNTNVC